MVLNPVKVHAPEQLATLLVCTFTTVLGSVAVGLRITARRIKRAPIGWDDWAIFVALVGI